MYMKILVAMIKKIADTENIQGIINVSQSYDALKVIFKEHNNDILNYNMFRETGVWGSFARQEVDRRNNVIKEPLVYFVEVFQFNRKTEADKSLDDLISIVVF